MPPGRPTTILLFAAFALGCAGAGSRTNTATGILPAPISVVAGESGQVFRVSGEQAVYAPKLPHPAPVPADGKFVFAVMGDNRGAVTGKPSPEFLKLIDRMNGDNPAFVLNTGDMIRGYTTDRSFLRDQWNGYLGAVAGLKAPMYHAPGNHDWFDAQSAKAYLEAVGPSFYSFDYGIARLVALDTESDAGRIGPEQFTWLERELETAVGKKVFIFLHRPLFPVDGHVGSSLDEHPADRDRLHSLFVKHKAEIAAVFAGHEHVYNEQVRDGITYYITGGGGAPLYAAPEKGGYYHYLAVRVDPPNAAIELRRTEASALPAGAVPVPR